MKIIHTADWHLGQSFYEYDRKAEHLRFLAWLMDIIRRLDVDILLIAGDIFDSPNPSAESQKIYYSFLREITNKNPHLQIIIIAGNHDSAARLEAPNPLLEIMNITTRGIIKRDADGDIDYDNLIIPLNSGGFCLAVPYLRQGDYPESESYPKSVNAMYDNLYEKALAKINDTFAPVIAMGHLQATGSEISENDRSERTIIGGLECVSPDAFSDGIAYTALGHLHRRQRVSGRENIRYSGTPIPMSFAEKNNKQGVVFIEINDKDDSVNKNYAQDVEEQNGFMQNNGAQNESSDILQTEKYRVNIRHLEFEGSVGLISIPKDPKPLREVLDEMKELPEGEVTDMSPYLEIKVLITEPEPSMRHLIEKALAGKCVRLARISAITPEYKGESKVVNLEELREANPMNIAEKIFGKQYGGEKMPESMKKLLHEVIQEIER